MFERLIARAEAFGKGMMFDCHACGQCVLQKTNLICPMSCPKGLRNGPCGGTLDGKCEVYPDRQCVWCRIHKKQQKKQQTDCPVLLPSPDSALFNTSSYLNMLKGTDAYGRRPLEYLDLTPSAQSGHCLTDSRLERALQTKDFVHTCEIRSPRSASLKRFRQHAEELGPHFDAINVTAYLNGKPSLPSPLAAAELVKMGFEPIAQATCRDHTKTSFVSELINNHINGVHNCLCLTGDSYAGSPKIKQVFDMDSSLMIYEARYLRERGEVRFTGERMKNHPQCFIGAAINPFTTPDYVPIRRLKQKIAAGADFIEIQLIFDVPAFKRFMQRFVDEGLDQQVYLLAGIPVVTSKKAFAMIPQIPGVSCPPDLARRIEVAYDITATGITIAREMIEEMKACPGVSGVHLMLFGSDHSILPGVINANNAVSD